jgi:hypothetical protein
MINQNKKEGFLKLETHRVNPLGLEPRALPTKVGMLYHRERPKIASKKEGF